MRATALAAMLGASALALINLTTLLGAGYARVAERRLDSQHPTSALAAAELASRLHPWSSGHAALKGWALTGMERPDATEAAYLEALRLAPADPLLWAEYALALARLGRFNASLTQAVTQAGRLAPQSPAVQATLADLGLSYWPHGNLEQHALWLESMRYELAHARTSFLDRAMTRGRGRTFCKGPADTLGEKEWCASIASALLGGCYVLTDKEPAPCKLP